MSRAPKPILDAGLLYEGDNGRVFCGAPACAGQSAAFTGRTISGLQVRRLDRSDVLGWKETVGRLPRCEGCGREAMDVLAASGAPATRGVRSIGGRVLCPCGHAFHDGGVCQHRDEEGVPCDCTEGFAGEGDRLPPLVLPEEPPTGFAVTVWVEGAVSQAHADDVVTTMLAQGRCPSGLSVAVVPD